MILDLLRILKSSFKELHNTDNEYKRFLQYLVGYLNTDISGNFRMGRKSIRLLL